jgi:hypothetical protein
MIKRDNPTEHRRLRLVQDASPVQLGPKKLSFAIILPTEADVNRHLVKEIDVNTPVALFGDGTLDRRGQFVIRLVAEPPGYAFGC